MRLLITGAYGFIGSYVVDLLLNDNRMDGVEFFTISRGIQQEKGKIQCLQYNLLDSNHRKALIDTVQPTHIIHLAWTTLKIKSYKNTFENLESLEASIDLFKLSTKYSIQKIVSTGTVYEMLNDFATMSNYATTKLSLMWYLLTLSRNYKIKSQWLRMCSISGIGDHEDNLIPAATRDFIQNKKFQCNTPYMIVDYLDIRDAAQAIVDCFFSDAEGIIDIGSGEGHTVLSLLEKIAHIVGNNVQIISQSDSFVPNKLIADTKRLCKEVGFINKFSLDDCLKSVYYDIIKNSYGAKNAKP